jgi:hypothetical protein
VIRLVERLTVLPEKLQIVTLTLSVPTTLALMTQLLVSVFWFETQTHV